MTRTGTSYFITHAAACRYYARQGYGDAPATVAQKLAEGEIHIGEPPIKAGEYRQLIDGKTRYEIVSP